ncbi:MAG: hypothetical protein GC160_13920 [Acidobacteria bacterium]|nr:hypothetical protein [Acidobacteriota bacterium]
MRSTLVSSFRRSGVAKLALLTALFAVGASAQSAAVVRQGSYEIGGMVGASYGIDKFRVMGGANVTFAATRVILPYFEYTYFPGLSRQFDFTIQDTGRSGSSIYEVPLTDVHGGVHIRIPVAESKFVPYLVAGVGVIRSPARDVQINVGTAGGTGTFTDKAPADTSLAANFGGGLRYYVNQRFGFRVEAKAYTPLQDFAGTEIGTPQTKVFSKFVGGIFIQLR